MSPHSQRTVTTLTSDEHETPPENPATELSTNSTPNALDHSSVQQTPADENPAASNKHLLTKPLKFLKGLSWSSATPLKNTRSVLTS